MFSFLFDTTFTVSLAEYLFIALVGAAVYGLVQYTRDLMRALTRDRGVEPADPVTAPPMLVIPANGRQVEDEPGVHPGPGWRRSLELEAAPLAPALPKCPSLVNFRPWKWEDARTGAFPAIGDELDVDSEVPPRQLPGFEVDESARARFRRSTAEMAALAAAQGFDKSGQRRVVRDPALVEAARLLPEKRSKRAKATVDLDAGTVVVS
jgi:hypothetical protein